MASVNRTQRSVETDRAHKAQVKAAAVEAKGSKAQPTQVPIAEVAKRFGWSADSWQMTLLKAADLEGTGTISCEKLDDFLAGPEGAITTADLQAVAKKLTASDAGVKVDSFAAGDPRMLAKRADKNSEKPDGKLTAGEWSAELELLRNGDKNEPAWIPDMKAAALRNAVAEVTGEPDKMRIEGTGVFAEPSRQIQRDYDVVIMNTRYNAPETVAYTLTAGDLSMKPPFGWDRSNLDVFGADPYDPALPKPLELSGTGMDRGHKRPAGDSPTLEALLTSFSRANAGPEEPELNQQVLAVVERALRELVQALGGESVVVSGSLYVDKKGQPDLRANVEGPIDNCVGVPKYIPKVALLETPDGKLHAFALKLPNTSRLLANDEFQAYREAKDNLYQVLKDSKTLPKDEADKKRHEAMLKVAKCFKRVFKESRVAVDLIEKDLGRNLFADLDPRTQARIEKSSSVPKLDAEKFPWAALVFGD